MRALITGSNGFIGRYVVKRLRKSGFEVKTLAGRRDGNIADPKVVYNAAQDVDVIIHLAGAKHDEPDSFETNVLGAKNIISASKKFGVKRIIHISTPSAKLKNAGLYGKTKAQAEKLMMQVPESIIIRPSLVYSNNLRGFPIGLVESVKIGFCAVIGNGNTVFAPILANDLAKEIEILASAKAPKSKIYDLGGKKMTYNQLILKLATLSGKRVFIVHFPKFLGLMGIRIFKKLLPTSPISVSNVLGSLETVPFDPDKFKNEFNFSPKDL